MFCDEGGHLSYGEKVRRKVVSPLRCLTVRDMTYADLDRLQEALDWTVPVKRVSYTGGRHVD